MPGKGYTSRSTRRPGPSSATHVPALRLVGDPVMQAFDEALEHGLIPVRAEDLGGRRGQATPRLLPFV